MKVLSGEGIKDFALLGIFQIVRGQGGLYFTYCISDSRHYTGCLLLFILSCLSGFLLPSSIASYVI